MVDVFVDRIITNKEKEKEWIDMTKKLIKANSYPYMMDLFIEASEQNNEEYWTKKRFDKLDEEALTCKVNIMDLADMYGLKPLGKKVRICPFHKDTNPSLSLSNEKGLFKCFGCGVSGGIIKFNVMLKRLKKNEDNKKRI